MNQAPRKPRRRAVAPAVVGGATAFSLMETAATLPPVAPSEPVIDMLHGVSIADPYRGFEDTKNPTTLAWLTAQGQYAAETLSRIEGRDTMAARIEALAAASGDTVRAVTRMPGGRIYCLKRKVGENQFKLMMRKGTAGPEQVLVDPDQMALASGVPHAINYFTPSWDGKTLACGVSAGGSEDAWLHLLDIASGKALRKPIPRVHEDHLHWSPDSRYLSFNQVRELPAGAPETETFLDSAVFLLDKTRPTAAPRALFGPLVNPELKLARLDVAEVFFAPGSAYMVARTTDTTVPEGRIYVAPLAALAALANLGARSIPWRQVSDFDDKITDAQLRGDTLYLRTYADAPRGRVLALRLALKFPLLATAGEVVPEPETGVLESFALGRRGVYTEVRQGFTTRVRRHAKGLPAQGQDVAPGLPGSTFIVRDPAHAHLLPWLDTSTWTEPSRILATSANGSTLDTGLRRNLPPPGMPELEVTEVLVSSHDSALVPLAILRRKGLVMDGSNPTLLDGYGAYGYSTEAFFDARSVAWLERGGVLAFANPRGSGAFGDAWYRAGFKASKSNTWKDGVACARWLIEQGFTSPKTLGIEGGSAGGIFAGRAVTSAPELFAAAIFNVGLMDAVRAEESANGITNTSEFGSSRNPLEFPALLEMSTYHQIQDGTAYPAVLLIHGLNDPRVDVWHSAKATARLQAASTSDRPVLLRLDAQAGHGVGSTASQTYSVLADSYSFLLWQFGKLGLR